MPLDKEVNVVHLDKEKMNFIDNIKKFFGMDWKNNGEWKNTGKEEKRFVSGIDRGFLSEETFLEQKRKVSYMSGSTEIRETYEKKWIWKERELS